MIALDVPPPELAGKPAAAPQLEQPVNVRLAPIHYPDGSEAPEGDAQRVGAYVYRLSSAGEELWNEAESRWTQAPADPSALPPLALAYKAGEPLPWQGLLIAVGMKDKDGQDRFAVASGGKPRYRLRAHARFKRDGVDYAGLSQPSAELAFVSAADSQRFGVDMTPSIKESPATEKVRIQLKNAGLSPAGYLEIRTSGGQEVELANCDAAGNALAVVQIAADGSIHLKPAPGKSIVFEGDLEAQRIRYQPSGGGPATDL